jgi:hypothetical protein
MYSGFHFYIDLNWEDAIDKTFDIFLQEMYQLVECAYQHKATVYYSEKQLCDLISILDNLDNNFSTSYWNQLDVIIENAIKTTQDSYAFEICFAQGNTSIRHIDTILSSVNLHDKIAIISFSNRLECFLSIKSDTDFCKIECKNLSNKNDIVVWISTQHIRTFNLNPKHGENGQGNRPNASVLLCSQQQAQLLLESAAPCFLETDKRLYNFDNNYNTFVIFYFEGSNPQNQWHGFHVNTHEWDKEIPHYMRKYFGK